MTLTLLVLSAPAFAGSAPDDACERDKLRAAGRDAICRARALATAPPGVEPELARCRRIARGHFPAAESSALADGRTCKATGEAKIVDRLIAASSRRSSSPRRRST